MSVGVQEKKNLETNYLHVEDKAFWNSYNVAILTHGYK